ncbi:hypothetical protein, partial [Streptococcus gallolyticus]
FNSPQKVHDGKGGYVTYADGSGLRTTFYDDSGAVLGVYETGPSSQFRWTQLSLNDTIPNGAVSAKIELVGYSAFPFWLDAYWSNVQFFYNYYIPVEPVIPTPSEEIITPPSIFQPDTPPIFLLSNSLSNIDIVQQVSTSDRDQEDHYYLPATSGRIQTVNHYLPVTGDGDNSLGLTIIGVGIILFLIVFIYNPKKDS